MGVRVVADRSGPQAPMFAHIEEYGDNRSNQAGFCQIRLEMRDGFISDYVLLVVEGKDNMSGVLEVLNQGVLWEDSIPNEEYEVQKGA